MNKSTVIAFNGSPGLTTTHIIYGACDGFVALLIVLGNLLIILAFWNEPSIRTITNAFILSLSLADLLVGLVGIPVYLYSMVTQYPGNFYGCLIINVWIMMLCTVSIMHLLAVSYDRFLVIVKHSIVPQAVKKRRACILIGTAWSSGILIGLLPVMGWNKGRPSVPRCVFIEIMDMKYLMFIFYATLVLPTLFMAIFYYSIYRTVHQHSSKMATMSGDGSKQARRQEARRKRVILSLFIVIVTFLVGWYPLYTLNAIIFYCPTCSVHMIWFYITIVISHLTSAINPVIYAWTMPGFSAAFAKVLRCRIGWKYKNVGLLKTSASRGVMDTTLWSPNSTVLSHRTKTSTNLLSRARFLQLQSSCPLKKATATFTTLRPTKTAPTNLSDRLSAASPCSSLDGLPEATETPEAQKSLDPIVHAPNSCNLVSPDIDIDSEGEVEVNIDSLNDELQRLQVNNQPDRLAYVFFSTDSDEDSVHL